MKRGPNPAKVQQWTERLERFQRSGLTVTEFCSREGVSTPSFYFWKKRLHDSPKSRRQGRPAIGRSPHTTKPPGSAASGNGRNGSPFQAVHVTASPRSDECLTVRLRGGVELVMGLHDGDLVERIVGQLLEYTTGAAEDEPC